MSKAVAVLMIVLSSLSIVALMAWLTLVLAAILDSESMVVWLLQ